MKNQRYLALLIAVGFLIFWLVVLYAGADHPPPPGFILVILLVLGSSLVVYFRVSTYISWSKTGKKYRYLRVLLDGLIAGFTVALIIMLIPGTGEPSVELDLIDRLIWLVVLSAIGAANALFVYLLIALLSRERYRSKN